MVGNNAHFVQKTEKRGFSTIRETMVLRIVDPFPENPV